MTSTFALDFHWKKTLVKARCNSGQWHPLPNGSMHRMFMTVIEGRIKERNKDATEDLTQSCHRLEQKAL